MAAIVPTNTRKGSRKSAVHAKRNVQRLERAAVGSEEKRQHERERILEHRVEELGREQGVEDAAEHAADREQDVELRQAVCGRPLGGEPPVHDRGGAEQRQQVEPYREGDRQPKDVEHVQQAEQHGGGQHREERRREPNRGRRRA